MCHPLHRLKARACGLDRRASVTARSQGFPSTLQCRSLLRYDHPKQAIRVAVRTGAKEELIGSTVYIFSAATAEGQPPQSRDTNGVPGGVCKLTQKHAGCIVEGIDVAIADVAHE